MARDFIGLHEKKSGLAAAARGDSPPFLAEAAPPAEHRVN